MIGDADGQLRRREITVAVGQSIGEDVVGNDGRAVESRIGIVAICVDHERTVLAGNLEVVRTVGRRDGRNACDLRDLRTVGSNCILVAVRRIGVGANSNIDTGYHIAGRRQRSAIGGIDVIDGNRAVILELDLQRHTGHRTGRIAVKVRQRCLDVQVGSDRRDIIECSRA